MTSEPLVSILIITMNHEKFIEQSCLSAINQTYKNKEIIFLDNISDDQTALIAEKTLETSSVPFQIIKINQRNGVAKNLNLLLEKSSGKYICILSGDDWWSETLVERKVKYAEENGYDYVLSDGNKYYEATSDIQPAYNDKDKKNIIDNLDNFFYENITENKTVNVGTFIKKEILDKYPFDEKINTEDWDMNLRVAFLGYKIGFVNEKLFFYRVLESSLSRKWKVMEDSYKKVTSKYIKQIEENKELKKKYLINLLKFKYEILLSETTDQKLKKDINKRWKTDKYKLKYKQPILAFKLLLNKF